MGSIRGKRKIYWVELLAGDKAEEKTGKRMPEETLEVLKTAIVSIKGPLGTPVGKGGRTGFDGKGYNRPDAYAVGPKA